MPYLSINSLKLNTLLPKAFGTDVNDNMAVGRDVRPQIKNGSGAFF